MTSGDNNKTLNATFNTRMLAATFSVTGLISKTYDYFPDGRLRFSSDLLDHRFDRSYGFDHVGRLTSAFSGAEARGEGATTNRPYYQTHGYDRFDHLTERTVKIWWTSNNSISDSYTNNRHDPQGTSWQYDADGRLMTSTNDIYTDDAAGLTTHIEVPATYSIHTAVAYDGDGQQVRTDETNWDEVTETEWTETKYYLRSSVLGGQVLTEIFGTNAGRTFVFAGGAIIAWQWAASDWESVEWEHKDPSAASVRRGGVSQELDPLGGDAGISAQTQIPDEGLLLSQGSSYSAANPNVTYSRDGIRVPADDFMALAGHELRDTLGLIEAFARQRAKPDLPGWIVPDAEEYVEDRIALEEALLSGKGIPDLLALLPPVSLAKALSNPQKRGLGIPIQDVSTPDDCYAMVSEVRKIARNTNVHLGREGDNFVQNFMDHLARRFTEFGSATAISLAAGSVGLENNYNPNEFGDVGFKTEYEDHTGLDASPNQVRHTIGGLIAGYVLGTGRIGRGIMKSREDLNTLSGQADTRLNRVTMAKGRELAGRNGAGHAVGLADWLRRTAL